MAKHNIVTARSVSDNTHFFIVCDNPKDAFNAAHELHVLGEHSYRQIRLRSSLPSKKLYKMLKLEDILRIGA